MKWIFKKAETGKLHLQISQCKGSFDILAILYHAHYSFEFTPITLECYPNKFIEQNIRVQPHN